MYHNVRKGVRIKCALIEAGLYQKDLGAALGMGYTTLNMKIIGERPWSEEEKERVAKILGKPATELFPDKIEPCASSGDASLNDDNRECVSNTQEEHEGSL